VTERHYGPIFGEPLALPRGPHNLSRAQVAESQRSRLMAAIADVVAEKGYAATTIAEIARRAGVSPRTFYDHFTDKLQCLLAAYETFMEVLFARMYASLAPDSDWREFILSTVGAYLETLEENPSAARAFILEMDAAGPRARKRRRDAFATSARLMQARHEFMRSTDPSLAPIPELVYTGIVHAVRELVADALEVETTPRLTELAPDIFFWIDATVRGAGAALEASEPAPRQVQMNGK
jgi:AcrR family transcriptional regulator